MLRQRILTALALAASLLVVLFALPAPAALLALALVVLGGAWEWGGLFGAAPGPRQRLAYCAVMAVLLGAAWSFAATGPAFLVITGAAVAWWIVAFFWILRFPTPVPSGAVIVCGVLTLVPAWLALSRLYLGPGPEWVLFIICLAVGADVGAFFVGRAVGRLRLSPKVSPGKTWEGLGGGLAVACAIAAAGAWWFGKPANVLVPLCIAVAMISVVGDLSVSMFKRHAGVKDSGDLLPGHGGLLDRVDSLAAAAPVFVAGLAWLGWL